MSVRANPDFGNRGWHVFGEGRMKRKLIKIAKSLISWLWCFKAHCGNEERLSIYNGEAPVTKVGSEKNAASSSPCMSLTLSQFTLKMADPKLRH